MKKIIIALFVMLSPVVGFAHGDHVPKASIEKPQVIEMAKSQIDRLIAGGKIDVTWKNAELVGTEKKKNKSTWEWINTFKNAQEKDEAKQTLYVYLTLSGEFVAANFTGK